MHTIIYSIIVTKERGGTMSLSTTDIMLEDDVRVKKFISRNKKILDKETAGQCNKMSLEIVGEINEYINSYFVFQKTAYIVFIFLKKNEKVEYGFSNRLMNIIMSVKKQFKFWCLIKDICKKVKLSKDEYYSLKRSIHSAQNRFPYLLERIIPEYMSITPAYSYSIQLKKQGKTFADDMQEHNLIEFGTELSEEKVNEYCDYILEHCDGEEWKNNLERYLEAKRQREDKINIEKLEAKQKKQNEKCDTTEALLSRYAQKIYKDFFNAAILKGCQQACMTSIALQLSEFTKQGKTGKIVLLAKSGIRSERSFKFFDGRTEGFISTLRNAQVIEDSAKLPPEIQDKIDSKQMVSCEIVLN